MYNNWSNWLCVCMNKDVSQQQQHSWLDKDYRSPGMITDRTEKYPALWDGLHNNCKYLLFKPPDMSSDLLLSWPLYYILYNTDDNERKIGRTETMILWTSDIFVLYHNYYKYRYN